jgi:hypothetical protein
MSNARDKANIPALNFSSTGIDDNATSTAITINSSQNVDVAGTITSDGLKVSDSGGGILEIEGTTVTSGDTLGVIKAGSSVSLNVDDPASIKFKSNGSTGGNHRGAIEFFTNDTVNNARRLRVTPSGDIAFYEDTGTTAKMLWDASTERLGIGTTSPLRALSVVGASNAYANFDATSYESFTIGSDISGFLIYSEDAAAYRFNIDSSGRVGIGETSMDALLVIKGDSNGTTNPSIRLKDGSDTREAIVSNTSGDLVLATMNSSDNVVDSALTIYTSQMIFKVDGSEAMRIDSSGNVGIGTSSPTLPLEVSGSGLFGGSVIATGSTTTTASRRAIMTHDGSSMKLLASGDSTHRNMIFYRDGGSDEAMRIDTSNRLMIGASNSLFNAQLTVNSGSSLRAQDGYNGNPPVRMYMGTDFTGGLFIEFTSSNGTRIGSITRASSTSIAFNTTSDYRLKENVVDLNNATTRLKQLKPKRFNFIGETDTTVDGFLAHEVSDIVPEAITGQKDEVREFGNIVDENNNIIHENVNENFEKEDGHTWVRTETRPVYQGIDQSKLVPLLVKTIQELEARITALETQP